MTPLTYPFPTLAPGEHFTVPCAPGERARVQRLMLGRAFYWRLRTGWRFSVKQVKSGVRVKREEEPDA